MKHENKGNPQVLKTADEAFKVGESVCHGLINEVARNGGSAVDALYCLGQMGVAIVQNMAAILAKQPPEVVEAYKEAVKNNDIESLRENFDPNKAVTAQSKLFAALLLNKISPDYDTKECGSVSEFGPHVYWEAINAFERLEGYAPDPYIVPGLIKAGRNIGSMGAEVLAAFMERQKLGREGGSSSLN